ncbi:MAG: glycosyltransferase [Verrucomicrobia bacterium]|nr:MAG: glycosyltransferase [Verrucomicrobiota bacterium]
MKISVITPSYKQATWLRRALASVADQTGAEVEHIIQDACSGTEVVDVCQSYPHVRLFQERDGGMYDAINKGWSRASGDILCWLNCDEQYLPGALAKVAQVFETNPDMDIIFGDVLLIRPDGLLIAYRKSMPLRWPYVLAAHLYVPSCAMFFRRRFFDEGFRFDPQWRAAGDADLVVRLLRAGYCSHHMRAYLACFTQTGANLGATVRATQERRQLLAHAPRWVWLGRPVLHSLRWLEKGLQGCYRQRTPIEYDVLTDDTSNQRQHIVVGHASFRWQAA